MDGLLLISYLCNKFRSIESFFTLYPDHAYCTLLEKLTVKAIDILYIFGVDFKARFSFSIQVFSRPAVLIKRPVYAAHLLRVLVNIGRWPLINEYLFLFHLAYIFQRSN